jgi:hypothetical protein
MMRTDAETHRVFDVNREEREKAQSIEFGPIEPRPGGAILRFAARIGPRRACIVRSQRQRAQRKMARAQIFIARNCSNPWVSRYLFWMRRYDRDIFSSFSARLCISEDAPVR